MTLQRDIGSIPVAALESNTIRWQWFVKVTIASVGTMRYTDAEADLSLDIDGAVQTWATEDVAVGNLDQGRQFMLNPSFVSFGDLPDLATGVKKWSDWANSPGLRNSPVEVWVGWWNTSGTFADSVKLYSGRIDNHRIGARAEIALKPWHSTWARQCPSHVPGLSDLLPAPLMPKEGETIHWNTDQKR